MSKVQDNFGTWNLNGFREKYTYWKNDRELLSFWISYLKATSYRDLHCPKKYPKSLHKYSACDG